jgi:hypothetical protein
MSRLTMKEHNKIAEVIFFLGKYNSITMNTCKKNSSKYRLCLRIYKQLINLRSDMDNHFSLDYPNNLSESPYYGSDRKKTFYEKMELSEISGEIFGGLP